MGRWAQRRRGSGGGGPTANLTSMTNATPGGPLEIFVDWSAEGPFEDLDPADFTASPSGVHANGIVQTAAQQARLDWLISPALDTTLTYSGSQPGFQSPQTINIS